MTKIDWSEHIVAFRASSQSAAAYCTAAGVKLEAFRYHLYKQQPKRRRRSKRFQEFRVATELVIVRDHGGGLSLSGFDLAQLPQIVGAWSNALS